jgi:hypothetical protein
MMLQSQKFEEYEQQIQLGELSDQERAIKLDEYLKRFIEQFSTLYGPPADLVGTQYPVEIEKLGKFLYQSELLALMSSMITGAWTSHEVLVADLWVTCLNRRPRLGFIAMNAEPEPGETDDIIERKGKVKFEVPARLLREWKNDLGNRMGSLLREKWAFSRRERAIDAYYKVFKQSKFLLEPILEDPGLRWVGATRNVIMHNAGIADIEFVTKVGGHPILKTIKEKDVILLDGNLVAEFVETAVHRSLALLTFVNDWLLTHKE